MEKWMIALIALVIFQKLVELLLAKKNEKWMKERGGIEHGKRYYKWFVFLHVLFFLVMVLEASVNHVAERKLNYILFIIFIAVLTGRIWCIRTLGKFWNTKIIVLPRVIPIQKGPYKYMKHPNYLLILVELCLIPVLLGAYFSAILFPLVHLGLLKLSLSDNEKPLTKAT